MAEEKKKYGTDAAKAYNESKEGLRAAAMEKAVKDAEAKKNEGKTAAELALEKETAAMNHGQMPGAGSVHGLLPGEKPPKPQPQPAPFVPPSPIVPPSPKQ